MANPNVGQSSSEDLIYVLNHVFLPPKLPQEDDHQDDRDIALCHFIYNASRKFAGFLSQPQQKQWSIVNLMLKRLLQSTQGLDQALLVKNILSLGEGDVLTIHVRAQNSAVILRRRRDTMVFEVFEVSPPPENVMGAEGKLICSYPGPAVELPLNIAHDPSFVEQLSSFLLHMDVDQLDAQATTTKAGSKVAETRGTTHPRYISQLLVMILCGMGKEAEVNRIAKRVADDVCWENARNPWRRSPLWLVLRVAIQTTADSRDTYKAFMVFFQTELLRIFLDHGFSSELLHVARVKTSRRVYKLGASASPLLLQAVEDASQAIEKCLQERWSDEQHLQTFSPSYTPDHAVIEKDVTISLLKSRDYLNKIMHLDPYTHTFSTFHPPHIPRLRDSYDFSRPGSFTKAVKADSYVALADFEFFVHDRLGWWAMENRQYESACEKLGLCLEQYISSAKTVYSSDPEDESLMLLTIMELWVALDVIAVFHCPLLLEYSPEIPSSILDPLLLRQAESIERAARVELYLRRRHSNSTVATSIYSDKMDQDMFSVRYFEQSSSMSALKDSIERHAADEREKKCAQLTQKNAEYKQLTEEIARLSCDDYPKLKHSRVCSKCKLQKRAKKMSINVHEWPLPSHPLEAKSVVFELNCPRVFSIWRTQTYQILRDICMTHISVQSKFDPHAVVEDYNGLATWSKKGTSGRITLGSETKSFLKSHYRDVKIPTDIDRVCVNNGLRFRLYDSLKGENVHSSFNINLDPYCTLRLPGNGEGLYRHLQYAVAHTTHSHNETIVNQGDCSMNLSIHEQLAFSNLRCGAQLQWINIARELRMEVLSFSREEVHTLITQAAWQIGPLSDDGSTRDWHFDLRVPDFGLVLIQEAKDLLTRVEANWIEGTTVRSIIYLTSRLLASAVDAQVQENGYLLLRKARKVTHKWMREILQKLHGAEADDEASELQRLACEMAATCRATFDVDSGTHLDALLHLSADVAVLVECAIMVHDHTPHHFGPTSPGFQKLLHRDRRLSHFLEPLLGKLIHADQSGLDTAIRSVWSMYRPGDGGWHQSHELDSRWLMSFTAPLPNQRAQLVHYNMLNGKLLVDGKPLGRLPHDIVGHSTYGRIFGQKILDVIPADMPGMDYATRSSIHGYQIFFSLRDECQGLIIRAQTPSGQVLELVPHHMLLADFPTFFATEHVHWMNIHSGELEFRPLDRLWERSAQNWRLFFSPDVPSRMVHGMPETHYLIDIRSKTFQDIAARIRPLEYSDYLTVVYDLQSQTILIELPRFRLSFFVSSGELESKNFQGMVIDNNQCTQTMIGLSSQLVLRHKDPSFASVPRSRCVLIPHGDVRFSLSSDQNHVRVHIDTHTKSTHQVTWYKYEIDYDLGLLIGNVNLTSRLYRIYLHALCSHPLPDPLTGQTGTDHALQELASAACFSFQKLTAADVKLLRLIGNITPNRNYYPKHHYAMQTVKWSPHLPALSQHGTFDAAVRTIVQYAQSLTIFAEPADREVDLEYHCIGDSVLMARATRRNSVYYEGGVDKSADFDQKYESRDSPHLAEYDSDGLEARNASRLVYAWPVGLTCHLNSSELLDTFKGWRYVNGPDSYYTGTSMTYNQEWLRLDLPANLLTIYDICRTTQSVSMKFELLFSFTALAYSEPSVRHFIPILLAFATVHGLSFIPPPIHLSYDLADGFEPLRERLQAMIISGSYPLADSPAGQLTQRPDEIKRNFLSRQHEYYKDDSQRRINNAADYLMKQQHLSAPKSPFHHGDDLDWFNTERIMTSVIQYFASCARNRDLRSFISQVTRMLQESYTLGPPLTGENISRFCFVPHFNVGLSQLDSRVIFTLENLLFSRANYIPARSRRKFGTGAPIEPGFGQQRQSIDTSLLENLISQFRRNSYSPLTQLYSERLERSRRELHGKQFSISSKQLPPLNVCFAYRDQCQIYLQDVSTSICSALAPSTATERILKDAGLWPRIHPRTLLYPLGSTANIHLTLGWAKSLTAFAEAFIEYQHSQRLLEYALRSEADNFFKELQNAVFNQSDAESNPDWLLIQIQGNFIVRPVQSAVAREMITPSSNHSTILQLNMGEGKSHVIVPLVAAALADSHKLARVIVLKPLAGQMFHLLVERISGLANRRIFYLPFSRNITMEVRQTQQIRNLFEECRRVQGILVAQPEHILSFRLMGVEQTLSSRSHLDNVAQELQKTQAWLTSTSRDILDESDALLHVRYQLIYTMGQQQPLDDSPDRWNTVQQIFGLVSRHITQIQLEFPEEVEFKRDETRNYGEFSHVRLFGTSASQKLVSKIAEDALDGVLDNLNFIGLRARPHLRKAVLRFIKERDIDSQTYFNVEHSYKTSALWKGLLLLRGLLAEGILIHVLSQQRWRVDYGLDLKRSLLAVPYRAKDVPSLRSEFGHPDVAICLTCLSYYYGGLTTSQVQECFELLIKLDNPPLEYEKWIKRGRGDVPEGLRQLIGVNMKDMQGFTREVVPIFQRNQAVVDFFLSQVVFPKDAKEFPYKLGTSGWDLVEQKANFTTGFSGTNDSSDLLPLSITQSDPVDQLQTNAQVLGYLLQPENDRYICTQGKDRQQCSTMEFLALLGEDSELKEVRVLLDVGAQMLEMTNQQLVEHWLSLRQDIAAGVFFDDADNLSVLSQDGVVEPLYSSSFFRRLDQCVVYLDDAHTRGTDLKLPLDFQAAVTLGPKITKDRLVQGCMRMRKLGHGQSVIFCAPPEVDKRIREAEKVNSSDRVKVIDVLSWAMSMTCTEIEHHIPHWVQQGVDYHQRRAGHVVSPPSRSKVKKLRKAWLRPASRSLDEMYTRTEKDSFDPVNAIPAMSQRLSMLGVTTVRAAQMEEEQEREVSHEVEQEQQLERPPRVPPAVHFLDMEVHRFVRFGIIPTNSTIFLPLMTPLRSKSDTLSPPNPWSRRLFATRDFMTTTKSGNEKSILTDYLRPVNWVVSHVLEDKSMILVVMSPYEVNILLQDIRASKYVRLHVYAPRTTQGMKPFDDLTFYCIPPLPYGKTASVSLSLDVQCQLNIWAGQLYLDQYETYLRLCLLLGVSSCEAAGHNSAESDRFVPKGKRIGEMADVSLVDKNPLTLLKTLFGLRRKGMSYQQTHIGKILHARLLLREDFE